MASFVINPGGPGGYVIPKRRNATEEEKKKERHGAAAATAEDDAKSASSSRAVVDNKKESTASRGTAVPPIRNPLNVWTGSLRFEDQTVESVDLYSPFRDSAKPNGFSASLDIKLLVTSADCQKYAPIAELFNARFHGTLLRRPHLFVCLPRSSPSSSSSSSSTSRTTPMQASYFYLTNTFSPLFARIYDKLKAKEIVAISALAGNAMLFLLPEGSLTERLGIPMHDKPVFHCIFLHPRPDIMDDLCRRGLLTTEQTPHEPSSADKFDGADEAVLALVDKYRRTCGLPTAKRSAPSPLNSLLSPGKPPPAGKPPTPYIPTPGGSAGYAPAALLKQQQRNASFGYHSNSTSSSNNQDDWQALLQPPPPPPPPMPSLASVQTALGGGTPRGILSHGSSTAAAAHKRDTLRSPGTEARRPKNQSLFKNALEQIRKINEESKSGGGTVPSATSVSDPFPSSSIPPLKTPSPLRQLVSTITAVSNEQQPLPAPPVPPNLPRDPRLLKHGNATASALVVVEKPNQQQQQVRCATIPVDARPSSVQSPPCDPRLKRISAEAVVPVSSPSVLPPPPKFKPTVPVLNVRPVSSAAAVVVPPPPPPPPPNASVFKQVVVPSAASVATTAPAPPNLGFKRAYGLVGMASSGIDIPPPPPPPELAPPEEKKMMMLPPGDDTGTTDQENVQQYQQQPVEPPMPCLHVVSNETIIDADVPMEIDDEEDDDNDDGDGDDDDADRPYSPSQFYAQAIPPPPPPAQLKTNNEETNSKDEYLDEEEEEEEEDEIMEEEHLEEKLDDPKQRVVGLRQKKWAKVKREEEKKEENESKKEEQRVMEEGKNGDENGQEKEKEGDEEDKVEQQREQKQRQNSPAESSEATRKEADEKGIQQSSPISLVRTLIPSLSPKGPSSPRKERRGANNSSKVSAASSASLNASGFGFDFLNWNSPGSPAKDAQMTSSSSSNLSSAFRADETFDVEQLLKQAEISVVTSGSSTRKEEEAVEKEDNDLRILHQQNNHMKNGALVAEETENNASPVVVVNSPASTPQSPVNNNNASSHAIAGMPIPTIPSSPASAVIKKALIQSQQQQHTSPPPLMAITVPPPLLHVPPPSLALTAVPPPPLIMPSQLAMATTNTNATAGGGGAIQKHGGPPQQQQMHTSSPTAVAAASVVRPIATIHPSYRMHRLDVPPPVLNIPPPFIGRPSASATTAASAAVADHNNKKMLMMNNPPCKAIVLLDPEMIMCCRIKLDQLRAVFVAASRNSVRVLLHQMITDKLIEVGVKAKPYMTLLDEFVAAGAVERMEPHQCDKSGLVLRELLACSIEVAARERRNRGNPKLRVLFLSAMIGPKSDDATKLGNSQIELVNAGQFVEQFK
ncbi:hypothetical protein niasHT_018184 [Heterodera trifolii]|uniref:Mediator of RNA polymerase II transcription subunit 25 n=1 Tax=Heterodera trifolii TaxID=157864 RepID=A0ABD2LEL8_9BILA